MIAIGNAGVSAQPKGPSVPSGTAYCRDVSKVQLKD